MSKYVTELLWNHIDTNINKTKIAEKVNSAMNYDILEVVEDNGVFWIERISQYNTIPNFVYKYAVSFYKRKGLKYLYDIPCQH